jgi:hypothetical protein
LLTTNHAGVAVSQGGAEDIFQRVVRLASRVVAGIVLQHGKLQDPRFYFTFAMQYKRGGKARGSSTGGRVAGVSPGGLPVMIVKR